jgi:hypothetical protein
MFDLLAKAFEALSGYPIIQAAVAILVLLAGIFIMRRGERDRKSNGNGNGGPAIPSWALYGPVHDAISAIHDMNEQSRQQVDLLERIDAGVQACKTALELIRNESRLR